MRVNQKQSRILLEEHAKASFNNGVLGRNELYVAIGFLLVGVLVAFLVASNRFVGLPFVFIGVIEIVKYPKREKRWVERKVKEEIFNKNLSFQFLEESLNVSCEEKSDTFLYSDMRGCLIFETGFLLKISRKEYYYISFDSIKNTDEKEKIVTFLKGKFQL